MKVSFDWVNGGEEFDLPGLAIAGQEELIEIQREHKDTRVLQFQAVRYQLLMVFVTTRHVLGEFGPAKAKEYWDRNAIEGGFMDDSYQWPESDFEKKFGALYEKWVVAQLGTDDVDKTREEVNKIGESIDLEKLSRARFDYETKALVAELYWRLKRKFKAIDVGIPGDPEEVPLTRENLALVAVYPDDSMTLHGKQQKGEVDVEDLLKPKGANDVEKN